MDIGRTNFSSLREFIILIYLNFVGFKFVRERAELKYDATKRFRKDINNYGVVYLGGDEGHEPLTSGAILLKRLRHVAVQAIDVLEVKVWQEEIIDVLRGGPVAGHQQRHGRHVIVDHNDRVAIDAVTAAGRGQHVLHVHGGRRRVSDHDVLHGLRPGRRVLAVRRRGHRLLHVLVAVSV